MVPPLGPKPKPKYVPELATLNAPHSCTCERQGSPRGDSGRNGDAALHLHGREVELDARPALAASKEVLARRLHLLGAKAEQIGCFLAWLSGAAADWVSAEGTSIGSVLDLAVPATHLT